MELKKKQRIAIIGTNGLPAKYGGFETLTHYLTLYLQDDFEFIVYCSRTPKRQRIKQFNNARLIYFPFRANGYQSVLFDIFTIIHAWFIADKLLVLGNSGALIFPLKILSGKKLVLNIGGLDWSRSKWSYLVKKYIHLSELICVKFSDIVITDNAYIQKLYKQLYGKDSKLIEYGGNHVLIQKVTDVARNKYPFINDRYFLSVSRAQSDNNIHMLLNAFEKISDKTFVIISNWHTSKYGIDLREKYKNKYPHIHIIDAIYQQDELDMIRSHAWLYIHSHSFCGTAPSLVEAMSIGLPVICYNSQTNIETTENESVYFDDEGSLLNIIKGIAQDKLEILGRKMKEIADRRYRWEIIASKYADCLKN
jgi:glycosyltransferase involved in cell wall biosynthesis